MKNIDECVILCGGESKRLKNKGAESKIFLPFGDKSLIAYQFKKMQEIFPKVFISCKESQREDIKQSLLDSAESADSANADSANKDSTSADSASADSANADSADFKQKQPNFDEIFIVEKEAIFAPSVGILAALEHSKGDKIFVLSCDCPLVKPKTIDILCKNAVDYDVICAKDSAHLHYLVGVWSVAMKPILRDAIDGGDFKLENLQKCASIKSIYFDAGEFLNINTRSEYKNALKLLGL